VDGGEEVTRQFLPVVFSPPQTKRSEDCRCLSMHVAI
jgi:hypothetical protein